ncbi:hypothetical protein BHE90_013976 [Fusarium euwallaceae]|uniref:Fucose-specific lectin n=1 Tax=Fusarium euwallaceae TaxID=1147111 RepID=A0A430L7H9_9HYPO|nr:hypothetical protein BHE90_013976 [Fusarium euwallaceae]
MGSNALLWNPLAKNDRLLVYYHTAKGHLGIQQWGPDGEGWSKVWEEIPQTPKGSVKVGTGLTALRYHDWISVYGIVTPQDSGADKNIGNISLLSPVPQSLPIQTQYSCLTGIDNGKGEGWLYYLKNDPPVIFERTLNNASDNEIAKGLALLQDKDKSALTSLASLYSVKLKKRFVFVQLDGGVINALDVKDSKPHPVTSEAKHGTTMAATSFTYNDKEVLVLYTIHESDGYLARSISTDGGVNWQLKTLNGAGTPTLATLSAASNSRTESIAVVFSVSDTREFQVYTDDWTDIVAKS